MIGVCASTLVIATVADLDARQFISEITAEALRESVLSLRLFTHGDTLGALNLYSRRRDAFDADAREEGLAIAAHVAIAIASAQKIQQLSAGLDARTVIGQATGGLMERFDLDPARAFGVLARLSSQHNVKLRVVAAEVVANRRDLDLSVKHDRKAGRSQERMHPR